MRDHLIIALCFLPVSYTHLIVGRVCMDQMMVRVDENVKIGDQVEIFGEHISLESMAKDLDTISYEVLCLISKRVPRVYVQDGQVKELL